ncbi:hypothetical protein J8L98_17305 [Pseudoalteromonas sp. MMG013]|uniref:DUF4878 domain-containing protein n=1 Tax=Pseudoalteromonas aurantia 208 TaxID=1314867 RepID=A0ABR9EAY3_9GAMM|nr:MULTISPECIES: hypothetical protein [Pseudoalteromonas]MBE0367907.1 hypothetical protein [Pseudoalteromonas aurantia 208]MBQ4845623.1 hypothetical protein [Pseudoalteromonas sp. MMG005]MBQ4848862.1 hypothetical protein [Pseudoalteromonas sp. MMG012]MBQ4863443.1 hypothetical protein [Pseudoalteromonas sp. MMG013]
MKYLTIILTCALVFLSGCGKDNKGTGESSSPGYTATAFFDALYNHNNLERAAKNATPRLARVMRSYGTAKQFTRNLVNMQFDQVTIELDMTNQSLREQYGETANINMVFTGTLRGEQVDDMRSVKLLRKKGKWYVDKINPDPFAR